MAATFKIKDWTFAPDTGMIRNGEDARRLEHRTAALLELLSRNPDRVISHSEIIEEVWDGRAVSPNSVAVAISDIRRALGDDPRQPSFVETLPKRGYRLIADVVASPQGSGEAPPNQASKPLPVRRFLIAALAAGAALAVLLAVSSLRQTPSVVPLAVTVGAAVNETGDPDYDALTASVTELLAVELARQDAFTVSAETDAETYVSGKLILWDGHPSMSIHAISIATGETIWSGMASGPETLLPRQVRAEIAEFADLTRAPENQN